MELLPFCRSAGIPLTPWGPLGGGFLTGRHGRGVVPPAGSRVAEAADDVEEAAQRRATERNFQAIDELRAVANECGASVPQVAIAWLLNQPGVAAPIIGPRTLEQLRDLLAAASLSLSADQLRRLGAHTAPPEIYPHRFLAEQNHINPEQPLRRAGNPVSP